MSKAEPKEPKTITLNGSKCEINVQTGEMVCRVPESMYEAIRKAPTRVKRVTFEVEETKA